MNRRISFSVIALGISSIITQIIVLREFLGIAQGNELVLGIILGNWMLLTGVGCYLAKYAGKVKNRIRLLIFSQAVVALLPILYIYLIRMMRNVLFLPGEMIGAAGIFWFSFVLLMPYCIIAGGLLTIASGLYRTKNSQEQIGRIYFMDSIGDILGGLLFSFILVYLFNAFQIAFIIMAVNLVAAIILAASGRNRMTVYSLMLILMLAIAAFGSLDLNGASIKSLYPGQDIVFHKESLYGDLVVTQTKDQLNFFENSVPLFTTDNTMANEEVVHYAMAQTSYPTDVLLISGGVAGTPAEILKYNVHRIDYVELDPEIIKIGKEYTTNLDDPRINIINQDGRQYVKDTNRSYDAVIIDLPDPSSAQLNRFYTVEFFQELKRILKDKGIISLSLSSSENYQDPATRMLTSSIYRSIRQSFRNIIIIPGERSIFVASDRELDYGIADLIKEKRIKTEYVNEYYLVGRITEDRIIQAEKSANEKARLNKDFEPVAYYYQLQQWLEQDNFSLKLFLALFAVAIIAYLAFTRAVPFAVFTTGFAASSLEIVIIICFQILYGYAYQSIAIIITMFMLGLAVGSYFMNRMLGKMKKMDMVKLESGIALFSLILPFLLMTLAGIQNTLLNFLSARVFIPFITMVLAIIVGMEFPLAAKLHFKDVPKTAAALYLADFMGAFAGAILVSVLLIPLFGLVNVCFMVAGLNVLSAVILWRS